jgi:predicted O-methyltransferase YrrM
MGGTVLQFRKDAGFAWKIPYVVRVFGDQPPDDMLASERSRLVVLEDGRPLIAPHQPHTEIRSLGAGRYSHWGDHVLFSTSDNTNPLTNGRRYTVVGGDREALVSAPDLPAEDVDRIERALADRRRTASDVDRWLRHHGGRCWRLDLAGMAAELGFPVPDATAVLSLQENGQDVPTNPGGANAIARSGTGLSVDPPFIHFAASDGSNPKLNGRSYVLFVDGRPYPVPLSRQARFLTGPTVPPRPALEALVRDAYEAGCRLGEARKGRPPGADALVPAEYRDFLAGLCRSRDCRRVLEIGTEHAHTTRFLLDAIGDDLDVFVTIDIVDHVPDLRLPDGASRFVGDAMRADILSGCLERFGHRPIDLLFVDSAHDYASTLAHYAAYSALLRPRFVVLDDIVLNESMAMLWQDLRRVHGADAVNACDLEPRVRLADCGFGLIDLSDASRRG